MFLTPHVIRTDEDNEFHKQVETQRIHFTEYDAEAIHGPILAVPMGDQYCPPDALPPDLMPYRNNPAGPTKRVRAARPVQRERLDRSTEPFPAATCRRRSCRSCRVPPANTSRHPVTLRVCRPFRTNPLRVACPVLNRPDGPPVARHVPGRPRSPRRQPPRRVLSAPCDGERATGSLRRCSTTRPSTRAMSVAGKLLFDPRRVTTETVPIMRGAILCLSAAAMLVSGCAFRQLAAAEKESFPTASAKNPVVRVLAVWQVGEGQGPDGLTTRGFAGQIFFLDAKDQIPSKVDGEVRVYLFDDQGSAEERDKPLHQFDYPRDSWKGPHDPDEDGARVRCVCPLHTKGFSQGALFATTSIHAGGWRSPSVLGHGAGLASRAGW